MQLLQGIYQRIGNPLDDMDPPGRSHMDEEVLKTRSMEGLTLDMNCADRAQPYPTPPLTSTLPNAPPTLLSSRDLFPGR